LRARDVIGGNMGLRGSTALPDSGVGRRRAPPHKMNPAGQLLKPDQSRSFSSCKLYDVLSSFKS
jgi:hypothetical protein